MQIVVLAKPVPDAAAGGERLTPDFRVDRAAVPPVVNPNDEYALEAALQLAQTHGGEVTVLAMAPASAPETIRKALAMGAHRGLLVTDEALAGSDTLSTARVLAAALRGLEHDLVLAGADTSDGGGGVVAASVAAILGLPYLSYAGQIEIGESLVRVRRLSPAGDDLIEAPLPSLVVCTQALGAPRYASLKGIIAARAKEIRTMSLAEVGAAPGDVGGAASRTRVTASRPPAARPPTRVVRAAPDDAAREIVAFLADRRLI